jgi:NADH-quinone oxidoreductase subunit F
MTDEQILERWRNESASLLPLFHAFCERDGYVSAASVRRIADALRLPVAEVFGTLTFYHHLGREPGSLEQPRVCMGPICAMRDAGTLLGETEGAVPMPCAGRCDDPIPILLGNRVLIGSPGKPPVERSSPLPPPNPGGAEECVFAGIREPRRFSLEGYRRGGGYKGLERAAREMTPEQTLELVSESKLAGRGGAGFPTGTKWAAVAAASRVPKTIVCNADEGEPGCFKDRALLDHDPHAVLEGMAIAAYATGATRGFIYLRYEYPDTFSILEAALREAQTAGYLGQDVQGRFDFEVYLRRGAGAYICGEEGSLLNSLENKRPLPRNRPPFPVTHGFENLPTAVNNVETLASVPAIVARGADWYRALGRNGHAGTKVVSLSGDVQKPGNFEVPLGLPLQTLLNDWAGGPLAGQSIQAVSMAGLSGGFLAGDDLQVTLDEPSIKSKGSFLGAGGIMVFDDSRDMVVVAKQAMEFFAEESCGKCFPCRIGTKRLAERLDGSAGPADEREWLQEVSDLGRTMMATSACGLGMAAPNITESLMKYFPERIADHLKIA